MSAITPNLLPGSRASLGIFSPFFEPQLTKADPSIPYLALETEPVTESGDVARLSISIGISV
jgi:hypothetical protein